MLQVDELQGLVYSFAGTFDAATYTVKAAESRARAEALGAERRMLESRTLRRNEVEEHVRRARRLALERRLRELAAEHEPVGARPRRRPSSGSSTMRARRSASEPRSTR